MNFVDKIDTYPIWHHVSQPVLHTFNARILMERESETQNLYSDDVANSGIWMYLDLRIARM